MLGSNRFFYLVKRNSLANLKEKGSFLFAVASDPLEIDYESSVAQAFIFHLISIVFIIRCAEDIEENKHTPRVHYFFSPFESYVFITSTS